MKKRILLRSGFIGAGAGIGVQLIIVVLYMVLKRSNVLIDKLSFLFNVPCIWIISSLVNAGLIQKHDGVAVIIVFFVYSAILAFVIGIAVYLLITWFRTVLRRI
ncbi:MAG: hypothetical protein WBC22_17270 [Sedimentisphaerales bacterium]